MDAVYMVFPRSWVSEPFEIKSYFEELIKCVKDSGYRHFRKGRKKYDIEGVKSIMKVDLDEESYRMLEKYCSIDKLDVPNEPGSQQLDLLNIHRGTYHMHSIPAGDDCNLETIKALRNSENNKSRSYLKYSNTVGWINSGTDGVPDMIPGSEPILFIRVYEAFKYTSGSKVNKPGAKCMFEIAVRGKQTLAEFRDKIVCSSDLAVPGDVSENPDQPVTETARERYKSGFIFIEDVFYNDFRDPRNIDYSAVIRNWAESKQLGPFSTADMATTKFEDLKVRLGYPYVYQHQGKCEHLIIFSDIRLLHETDPLISRRYPRFSALGAKKTQYCLICNLYAAKWITLGNSKVTIDPCYFCDKCFKSFNYIDGKKVGEFKAYQYHDQTLFLWD